MPPQAARLEVHSDRQRIQSGEIVQIYWTAVGAADVLLEPSGQRMPTNGRMIVRPEITTTYWLSATNAVGGETRPLTIYVTDNPNAPATVPAIVPAPAPAPEPVVAPPQPQPPPQPPAAGADQAWIQVVALTNRANAERLVEELFQRCGERPVIQEVADPKGKLGTLLRVRFGPFPSAKEAKLRLRALGSKLKGTGSTAFVTLR